MRNNLGLWSGYSIELNALNEEQSIGRLSDPAHDWARPRTCLAQASVRTTGWRCSYQSLATKFWSQGSYGAALRSMNDQRFKIPQMGDVEGRFHCDRQITGVIHKAHVWRKSEQQQNYSSWTTNRLVNESIYVTLKAQYCHHDDFYRPAWIHCFGECHPSYQPRRQ